jgi:hypothetical protein
MIASGWVMSDCEEWQPSRDGGKLHHFLSEQARRLPYGREIHQTLLKLSSNSRLVVLEDDEGRRAVAACPEAMSRQVLCGACLPYTADADLVYPEF